MRVVLTWGGGKVGSRVDPIERPGTLRIAGMEAAHLDAPQAVMFGITIEDREDRWTGHTGQVAKLLCVASGHIRVLITFARDFR